jgi:hypothetical protein
MGMFQIKIETFLPSAEIEPGDELSNVIKNNITNYIKRQRLSWFRHVYRMTNDMIDKKLCEWKPIYTGLAGKPKTGWETIKDYLRIMKINNWTKRIENRVKLKEVDGKAKTLKTMKL